MDLRLIASADLKSDAELTRSELERLFLSLCRRHRLPQPEVNARIGSHEVDFLWRDRAKDARLQALGFRVLRFTHRQLTEERSTVVAALRALLGQRSLTPDL